MSIDWAVLRNPILSYPDWSVKDVAVIRRAEDWLLFFSAFYEDGGQVRSHIVGVQSSDLCTFSEPFLHHDGQSDGWIGSCSPDVVHQSGRYYLTFNTWGDKEGKPNQLFYMISMDGIKWDKPRPLAHTLTAGKRAIDAALDFTSDRIFLLYKEEQRTRLASALTLDDEFTFVGEGLPEFLTAEGVKAACENYQFISQTPGASRPSLLATRMDKNHRPCLFAPTGSILHWHDGRELLIPAQEFNSLDRANAACLINSRDRDGYFYLFYAGNREKERFLGRGHNRIAIARSRDMLLWDIPQSGSKQAS